VTVSEVEMSDFSGNPITTSNDEEISCCESDDERVTAANTNNQRKNKSHGQQSVDSTTLTVPAASTSRRKNNTTKHPHTNEATNWSDDTQPIINQYDSDVMGSYNNISEATTTMMAGGGPTASSPMSTYHEDRMRRKLQFFFMNPIEKWQAKRRFPYKFVVQVIKIILVTMQLCLFAHSRYNHINFTYDNKVSFSHLFLRGWESSMEVSSYPPETGPLSVYVKDDFYTTIDFAAKGYSNLSAAIGE
jgi:hypothetical protein